MELTDKVTIVTGGASGIGRALCRRFAADGARHIVVTDMNADGAMAVATELGDVARGVGLDVTDEAAIVALVEETESAVGPVDVFVSNAGYGLSGGLDLTNEQWQRMMDVHVMAHLYAARAVVPSMAARGEGYILNTASAAGLLTQMDSGPYAVSKHAAVAFAEWLSINYGDDGVKVSVLCPQAVRTNIIGDLSLWEEGTNQAALDGVIEPEAAADACVRAMNDETFLVLPHPEVLTYFQRKGSDYDRWLNGMRRYRRRLDDLADDAT